MKDLLVKGIAAVAAAGVTIKAISAVKKYKNEQELYAQVEEDSEDEK